MHFNDRALAAIDGLHRLLQAWFRAEGEQDQALVMHHFDPCYSMVTPTGKTLDMAGLRGALPGFWGSRPGLVMEIGNETLLHAAPGLALLSYTERQRLNGSVNDRACTVLMLDRGPDASPAWRHLHETMIA